ncbi:MAG: acetylxylan esterase [Tannerellaceae bacterium]|jgi:cephalosporin-C deacetylase-like acetyl esterase|nr:acetylxylan esterase [Tannerellaceae bacterium]
MRKKVKFALWLFAFACAAVSSVYAQPAQRVVNVVVSPDHSDWKYKSGEEVTFMIQTLQYGNLMKDALVDYELGPEFFPSVVKKDVRLKDGKLTLKATMKEPGFLRCRVVAKLDGREYEGMATASFDAEKIVPATEEPADFDAYWSSALSDARKIPLNPMVRLLPERSMGIHNVYEVSFQNERYGSRIFGILMTPKKPGKYPAVLQVPGAGVRPYYGVNYGEDVISLEIGIHGISVTLPPEVYSNLGAGALFGYQSLNKNDKSSHYYRRVYTGCVRAVDFIYSLPEFDGTTVAVTGGSQGGALSIVTAALDKRVSCLAAFYPALCDHAGYLKKRAGGWPHYFRNVQPEKGEMETLAYFDVVNFARRVTTPGIYSWGFNDTVCPPTSMYSAYNVISAPKELRLFLDTGHWTYPEQGQLFRDWLADKLKKKN